MGLVLLSFMLCRLSNHLCKHDLNRSHTLNKSGRNWPPNWTLRHHRMQGSGRLSNLLKSHRQLAADLELISPDSSFCGPKTCSAKHGPQTIASAVRESQLQTQSQALPQPSRKFTVNEISWWSIFNIRPSEVWQYICKLDRSCFKENLDISC